MNNIDQQQLSAYLDNELSADARQQVEQALAGSADLRAELEQLRLADQAARDWFSDIDSQPLPAGLEQMIQQTPLSAQVIPLQRRVPAAVWGLAASLLMAVGLVWQLQTSAVPDSRLQQFADSALSGDILDTGDWKAELVMSWQQADGRRCRELIQHTPQASTTLIACGQPGNWAWQTQNHADDQYQTASGPGASDRQPLSRQDEQMWLNSQP